MTASIDALNRDLNEIAQLLRNYKHYGQAGVVEEILRTLETSSPDYKRLRGIDMWEGPVPYGKLIFLDQSKVSNLKPTKRAFAEPLFASPRR